MGIQISEDIAEQAIECEKQSSCLSGNLECLCKARKYVADEVLLIENGKGEKCVYLRSLGRSQMCLCPVRKEISKRYGV
jgi:hypothetical protein